MLATEPAAPIRWWCNRCDDQGLISNWENSPFDLRRRRLTVVEAVHEVVISAQVAAALRELRLLDPDGERVVYRIRADVDGAILGATDDELDELIASVAAEAIHEPNRPRRKRLEAAFDALSGAQTSRSR